jgi:hypothetical protein
MRNPIACRRSALALVASAACFVAPNPAWAEDHYGSVLFQNDAFVGHDGGGYTNGIYFSRVRAPSLGDVDVAPGVMLSPIATLLGVPRATLTVASFGQGMVTPSDLSRRQPDPKDAPYAGVLAFRSAQVQVDGDMADMVALNLGVIGPASGAAQTQRFIHRITGSDKPEGWDTQVSNRPLVGLERARAWRFPWGSSTGRSGDLIAQAEGTLGNLQSSAGGGLMLRYGSGLARSFSTTVGANGLGADPFLLGEGWFAFAGVSGDRVFNHVGVSGEARLRKSRGSATLGFAYGWTSSSLTFSVHSADPVVKGSHSRQTFGSLTYVVRL